MGLIWLDKPTLWHSSRIPSGYPDTLTEYQIWLKGTRFRNWYTADWDYGLTIIYFFLAGIALFTIVNVVSVLRSKPTTSVKSFEGKVLALFRFLKARQFTVSRFGYYSPPLGAIAIVLSMLIFILALALGTTPYYWPTPDLGHSPPLATRSGWMSIAIMPFMIVLGTKFNFISLLTGVSHEDLQVYHRWSAVFMYITSLLHTFPFLVFNIREGFMVNEYKTTIWYWTGLAALIPQTWLIFMSWGIFRNRYYELFKKLHFIAAGIFMAALFIHCDFTLTSWDYFWATAALYGVSWVTRHIGVTLSRNGLNLKANFEILPDRMLKVTIPTDLDWYPGQHFIIRFLGLGIHALSSHPFTIASRPSSGSMDVYIRVHNGMTKRLLSYGARNKTSRVLVDGPYGGLSQSLRDFEHVLLLSGGSGVSFAMPLLLDLVQGFKQGMTCKHVMFVWAVSKSDSASWFSSEIMGVIKSIPDGSVTVVIHVTQDSAERDNLKESQPDQEDLDLRDGRPDLRLIIKDACSVDTTVGIAACGPDSFTYDCRNAVADAQLGIAMNNNTCRNVFLHSEAYSW